MQSYSQLISSSLPFPPLSWWIMALEAKNVVLDTAEHYQKMSYRNRYYLACADGKLLMSLPLRSGRNQRQPVKDVIISDDTDWQSRHWKTITSLYRRSPFFEYYEHLLLPLFEERYESLHAWNKAGISKVRDILRLDIHVMETKSYRSHYPEKNILDIRETFVPQSAPDLQLPEYYQVFSERCGFQKDCSILDLLFCEGNQAISFLQYKHSGPLP